MERQEWGWLGAYSGGAFFDIRDGKIARVTNYYNLQDWIAQVR